MSNEHYERVKNVYGSWPDWKKNEHQIKVVLKDGEPCNHPGCLNHISHPCEGCGRLCGMTKTYAKLDKKQLEGFYPVSRLCGHHDARVGINISIDVITDPLEKRVWFRMSRNHRCVYEGPDLDAAIEKYNNVLENSGVK